MPAMTHPRPPGAPAEDSVYHLATALLAAESVDDILSAAPPLVAVALDSPSPVHIDLSDGGVPEPESGRRIPLVAGDQTLGALVVGGEGALDRDRAAAVAGLLATAIATRRRVAAEHERLLQEASGLKLDVVSMLSHEMRTPLASIKGYASALRIEGASWDGETRGEFLQTIEEEADHLTRLVEDILESAAIDAGLLRLNVEPILIPKIARRVIDRVGIQSDRHRFVAMFSNSFPVIEADAQRIVLGTLARGYGIPFARLGLNLHLVLRGGGWRLRPSRHTGSRHERRNDDITKERAHEPPFFPRRG